MIWKVFASCLNHFRCKYWIFLLSIKFWEQNWVALAAIISMFNCKCFCYKRRCVESVSIIRKALIKSHIIMEFLKNLSRPFGIIKYSLRYREILPVFSLAFLWIFHGNLQSSFIYFFLLYYDLIQVFGGIHLGFHFHFQEFQIRELIWRKLWRIYKNEK